MKVILLQKVAGLGDTDDIKEVADGYAVNYLFPRHLAVLASPKAITGLKTNQQRKAKQEEMDLRDQQSIASRLDGQVLSFTEKTNDAGFLYAAVGPQKVAEYLEKQGFNISKDHIQVKPIKETGEYSAIIKLRHGLEAKVLLIINSLNKSSV